MNFDVQRSIFATNAFASEFPEQHTQLWKEFEEKVPQVNRIGYYGADNVAYIGWLRSTKNALFNSFLQSNIATKHFDA
ncbi:hypothetical protein PUW25_25960 (plasmid) [Paenibacillus urinalis]|uniref:Uncharacterized protein n=1 Tax=Paenibacillus urinalis TaxID=521520 RepID=A0ABY7XGX6_9BACL|nr:hypothetical protein [Paenibacillus urinalis]WDI05018.1 hypothetical protein PUW25_25960 [Paenibacillus urinalis]